MNVSEALESKYAALRLSQIARAEGFEDRDNRRRFGAYERAMLTKADAYFWNRPIADAVLVSSLSLPRDTKLSLSRYAHGETGWFWFERPVHCAPLHPFVGILWTVRDVGNVENEGKPERCLVSSTYVIGSRGLPEVDSTFYLSDLASLERLSFDDQRFDKEGLEARARELHVGDEIGRPSEAERLFAFLLSALLWIEQTILVPEDATGQRHVRRRLERAGIARVSALKVITLRRSVRTGTEDTDSHGDPVEWSCQWIVTGHWRQQFYPSTGERRPRFILPYIKGPEDKPLKPPAPTVFAVAR